jgi:hypothetical protein
MKIKQAKKFYKSQFVYTSGKLKKVKYKWHGNEKIIHLFIYFIGVKTASGKTARKHLARIILSK